MLSTTIESKSNQTLRCVLVYFLHVANKLINLVIGIIENIFYFCIRIGI